MLGYRLEDGIAVVTLENPPVNALGVALRQALDEAVTRANKEARAIVLAGAGRCFCAGADINEFGTDRYTVPPMTRDLAAHLEDSDIPVVAAIHGSALGGGLELALACHARVAEPGANLGLPEVTLGIIPGAGGTQRLPRLAGFETALDLIISGKQLDASAAHAAGIVDELAEADVVAAAIAHARKLVTAGTAPRRTGALEDRIRDADPSIFEASRKRLERRARGQLAPFKAVEAVQAAARLPITEGVRFEKELSLQCHGSPQRAALVHVFKAERAAGRIAGIPPDLEPGPVRRAAVIGAGTMGGGIAMCFARAGIPVTLVDVSTEAVERGRAVIEKNFARSVSRGSFSQGEMDRSLGLIHGATDYGSLKEVDVVIEAVFEDLQLKEDIFRRLDGATREDAVLATNTSSLDIDRIAAATTRPEQVVGMHFFSPAHVMKLLENVRGARTSPRVLVTVMALGKRLGKVPVLAGNSDGFIGNRMLQFYTGGAEYLLEEGATPAQIDAAMEEFGYPMGPCAMRDLAGNDVGLMIRRARAPNLPKEERLSPILERLVDMGRLGQKSGAGFYRYEGRERIPDPELDGFFEDISAELGIKRREIGADEIRARLLHPLVNEGARVLEDGIAMRSGDIDVVYCYGYGFPKFRGGPMYWAEAEGLDRIGRTVTDLAARFGPRYAPAKLLQRLIDSGGRWDAVPAGGGDSR